MSEQSPAPAPATTVVEPSEKPSGGIAQRLLSGAAGRNLGLIIALLLLVAVGWITAGQTFMNVENMLTIIRFASIIGVISIGMTFVITAGGIDLSVGSVMGLASVVASLSWIQTGADQSSWLLMVVVAIAVGGLAGLINGLVIAYGRVVPFMATLAMLVAARGLAELLSNKQTQIVSVTGLPRLLPRRLPRHPVADLDLRARRGRSAGSCSAAPRSAGARSRSAATSRPPASRASA